MVNKCDCYGSVDKDGLVIARSFTLITIPMYMPETLVRTDGDSKPILINVSVMQA